MTKSMQLLISRCLPPNQLRLFPLSGVHVPHLDELLCFSNYFFGVDAEQRRVHHSKAVSFADFREDPLGFREIHAPRTRPDATLLNKITNILAASTEPWVCKMFPAELKDLGLEPSLVASRVEFLMAHEVKVLAFSSSNLQRMFRSRATSLVHGTNLGHRDAVWDFVTPTEEQVASFRRKSITFHAMCADLDLEVLDSESLPTEYASILAGIGLDASDLTFPPLLEYTGTQ